MKKRKTDNCEHVGRRSKRQHSEGFIKCCIFCRTIHDNETLHNCSTMELDKSIREMATQLQDIDMLTLMTEGDLVAIGAKYHLRCLVAFRNRYRSLGRDSQKEPCNGDIILPKFYVYLLSSCLILKTRLKMGHTYSNCLRYIHCMKIVFPSSVSKRTSTSLGWRHRFFFTLPLIARSSLMAGILFSCSPRGSNEI